MALIPVDSLFPQQEAVLAAPEGTIVVSGGIRTAKTVACCFYVYTYCINHPGAQGMILMQTMNQLNLVFLHSWKQVVPRADYEHNQSRNTITMNNGAVINLQYADHKDAADRIVGATLAFYYVSQAETVRRDDLCYMLNERLSQPGYPLVRIFDMNGGNPGRFCIRHYKLHHHKDFLGGEPKPIQEGDVSIWHDPATVYTHVHVKTTPETSILTEAKIAEHVKSLPEKRRKRMLDGDDTVDEGLIYEDFDPNRHVADFDVDPTWRVYRAIDFGMDNPFVCLWFGVDNDDNVYLFDEHYATDMVIAEHIPIILGRWTNLEVLKTVADPSNKEGIGQLKRGGIPTRKAKNAVEDGIDRCIALLRFNKLKVHTRCVNFLAEVATYEREPGTVGKNGKELPRKWMDHAMDAWRYFMNSGPRLRLGTLELHSDRGDEDES